MANDHSKVTADVIRAAMALAERDVDLGLITIEQIEDIKRTRFAPVERKKIAEALSAQGMSNRQIAKVTGATHTTINRDLGGTNVPESGTNVPPPEPQGDVSRLDTRTDPNGLENEKRARQAVESGVQSEPAVVEQTEPEVPSTETLKPPPVENTPTPEPSAPRPTHRERVEEYFRQGGAAYDGPNGRYLCAVELLTRKREVLSAIVLDHLDLPADPWPGLTYDDLTRMIRGRPEAKTRDLPIREGGEVDLLTKIKAAAHRAWLEKKPRGRPRKEVTDPASEGISANDGSKLGAAQDLPDMPECLVRKPPAADDATDSERPAA
jgi:hypothetical protein